MFGFNGQEKDDEVSGVGNSMTAEFWQYDSRLGRRFNKDLIVKTWESSYATFSNNPIYFVDPYGLTATDGGDGGDVFTTDERSDPGMMGDRGPINKEIGRKGNLDQREASKSSYTKSPKSPRGRHLISYWKLAQKSNEDLLDMMFEKFPPIGFSAAIEKRFRENTGGTFTYVNNDGLPIGTSFSGIQRSIQAGIEKNIFSPNIDMWDISDDIKFGYLQPFTDNPTYAIPIGGIQKVVVTVHSIQVLNHTPQTINEDGSITPAKVEYKMNLTITIYDTFGVDEGDFVDTDFATIFGRKALAAFWYLQHNRGYKPLTVELINNNVIISGVAIQK